MTDRVSVIDFATEVLANTHVRMLKPTVVIPLTWLRPQVVIVTASNPMSF